ncbi:LysR family transcriptional regulator [Thalassomonas viridans]|uniref:LysR family transcriptional regulator n=1 Tax=Thalassomonas viridans TaxID=137584 RepID=A0AAE9Z926_9GAMM|nr:LysR family transcriptional regulator [Thalassomonas viridans]WDE08899.1 LysR family transcriptional regulator [Thalassomonas viridans]WDE08946.1 LysR family transcriptional regulator [Thalassomonas viridans]
MNFEDLRKVIHLAHSQNIQASADALNLTPGALSKTLKKIEQSLNTDLFDRVGRNIQLNSQGEKFVSYAARLVHEYEQMCSEFSGGQARQVVNVTGPSVLLNHCLQTLISLLPEKNIALNIDASFEGQAVKRLVGGHAHIAIVTGEALSDAHLADLDSVLLGTTTFKVIAAGSHQLFSHHPEGKMTLKQLLAYPFVCPSSSPFCGIVRGIGSDGWPDQQFPRNIAFRTDDFSSLLSIVSQGQAIAYVPDFVITSSAFRAIELVDFQYHYREEYSLVYKPAMADGWLNRLVAKVQAQV